MTVNLSGLYQWGFRMCINVENWSDNDKRELKKKISSVKMFFKNKTWEWENRKDSSLSLCNSLCIHTGG